MLNRFIGVFIVLIISLIFSSCGQGGGENQESAAEVSKPPVVEQKKAEPLTFKDIRGFWKLNYGNNYGYSFHFYKNYRATVVLSLSNSSLVFRGVYNLEDDNLVRINISEMKRTDETKSVNVTSNFIKTKSSYFVFHGRVRKMKRNHMLELRLVKIFIDGNGSEGYFEPLIKLKRIKR